MTTHLTMNTVIHAAFRRDLDRYDAALATFPDGSQPRADQLKTAWDWFESELHHHHEYEETYFWPALQRTTDDLPAIDELDAEHEAMREALVGASAAMTALHVRPTAQEAAEARVAVAHLADVLLTHLEHEERDLEPISALHADAPAMKDALKKVKKANMGRLGNVVSWLDDGATDADRKGLRREIPAPVVLVAGLVGGRHYRRNIATVWD